MGRASNSQKGKIPYSHRTPRVLSHNSIVSENTNDLHWLLTGKSMTAASAPPVQENCSDDGGSDVGGDSPQALDLFARLVAADAGLDLDGGGVLAQLVHLRPRLKLSVLGLNGDCRLLLLLVVRVDVRILCSNRQAESWTSEYKMENLPI